MEPLKIEETEWAKNISKDLQEYYKEVLRLANNPKLEVSVRLEEVRGCKYWNIEAYLEGEYTGYSLGYYKQKEAAEELCCSMGWDIISYRIDHSEYGPVEISVGD